MFKQRSYRIVVGLLAGLGLAFLALPVVITVVVSFEESSFISFPPTGFSLRWYGQIGAITRIVEATITSLQIALVAATAATLFGGAAAFALVRGKIPLPGTLTTLLASPISLPMIAIGMALVQFFIQLGVAFTWWSLVIGHVVLVIAYPLRMIASALLQIDASQEQAARSLGATSFTTFRTVTLAQIGPGVISGFLFAFLISFDNYPISLFLVRGEITTMPIELFNYINQNLDPTPAAFSTVYILVLTILIAAAEKRYRIISLAIPR